jgi:hypothetical protein
MEVLMFLIYDKPDVLSKVDQALKVQQSDQIIEHRFLSAQIRLNDHMNLF